MLHFYADLQCNMLRALFKVYKYFWLDLELIRILIITKILLNLDGEIWGNGDING